MSAPKTIYVVDIIGQVVSASATSLGVPIHYEYGPIEEIVHKLVQMSKAPRAENPKYPLVAVITDIREECGRSEQIYCDATLRLLVVNNTKQHAWAEDRTTHNFKAVIHPIWEELQNQLRKSHKFDIEHETMLSYTKYDRYNWGRSQSFVDLGQGSADYIDATDITITLPVKAYRCYHK